MPEENQAQAHHISVADGWWLKSTYTTDVATCWTPSWRNLWGTSPRAAAPNLSGPQHMRASCCQTHRHLELNAFFIVPLIQRFCGFAHVPKREMRRNRFLAEMRINRHQRQSLLTISFWWLNRRCCTQKQRTLLGRAAVQSGIQLQVIWSELSPAWK
jgi:hypothetical protein